MTKDEYLALLGRGEAAWNAWRAEHDERPDLSGAALRGLDLSRFDLSRADLRGADLRGIRCCDTDLSGAQLVVARDWQLAFRDEALGCGAPVPDARRPE